MNKLISLLHKGVIYIKKNPKFSNYDFFMWNICCSTQMIIVYNYNSCRHLQKISQAVHLFPKPVKHGPDWTHLTLVVCIIYQKHIL